jgi:geranylgeranyl diphosphate synthase, type II
VTSALESQPETVAVTDTPGMDRYGAVVRAALLAAIPAGEPRDHLYALVADYPRRGGKHLRPALCLATCGAFGGRADRALDVAVALELLHNGFLIHDDIEDESSLRRGEPTLHRRYGVARALNAGDALSALALGRIAEASRRLPGHVARTLVVEFAHLMRRTVEGQAVDLGWIIDERTDVSEAEYLAMIRDKTCWYSTIHPLRMGALIGSAGRADLDAFISFGFYLGAVFQIHDDLENLLEAPSAYEKDPGGDVLEGKRTLPLIHLLSHCRPDERLDVLRLVGPGEHVAPEQRVATVLSLMERYGSLEHTRNLASALAGAAAAEFGRAFAGCTNADDLQVIMALVSDLERRSREIGRRAPTGQPR